MAGPADLPEEGRAGFDPEGPNAARNGDDPDLPIPRGVGGGGVEEAALG
jgi:hypothetical protein